MIVFFYYALLYAAMNEIFHYINCIKAFWKLLIVVNKKEKVCQTVMPVQVNV